MNEADIFAIKETWRKLPDDRYEYVLEYLDRAGKILRSKTDQAFSLYQNILNRELA